MDRYAIVEFTIFVVVIACFVIFYVDSSLHVIRRHNIIKMNREAAKHLDISGWLVLIDTKKKIVGLYNDGHSISHDNIHLGKDVLEIVNSGESKFTLKDFQTLDVDVPRISYRVLYEYEVPHSTPVIFY